MNLKAHSPLSGRLLMILTAAPLVLLWMYAPPAPPAASGGGNALLWGGPALHLLSAGLALIVLCLERRWDFAVLAMFLLSNAAAVPVTLQGDDGHSKLLADWLLLNAYYLLLLAAAAWAAGAAVVQAKIVRGAALVFAAVALAGAAHFCRSALEQYVARAWFDASLALLVLGALLLLRVKRSCALVLLIGVFIPKAYAAYLLGQDAWSENALARALSLELCGGMLVLGGLFAATLAAAHRAARAGDRRIDAGASFQALLDALPFPFFAADTTRVVVADNAAFRAWFSRTCRTAGGRHLRDIFGEKLSTTVRAATASALKGESGQLRVDFQAVDGSEYHAEFFAAPNRSAQGTAGFFGAFLPISQNGQTSRHEETIDELTVQRYLSEVEYSRKRIEQQAEMLQRQSEEISAARDQALAATQAKSAFLANMSHELRTPLNGIVTMANLLCEESLSPSQLEYAEIIKVSSDALLTIINDILDFSKIEAGKLTISPHAFALRETLRKMLALLQPQMQAKDIVFVEHIDPQVPDQLVGDSGRLRQVLINLLGNSIKFTPQGGGILFCIFAGAIDESNVTLRISVSDSGIGIAPEKLEKIFGAFDQEDDSTTRHYGGTGLGLSISRRLVELMDGRMQVRSIKGSGSTFYIELRIGRQTEADMQAAREEERLAATVSSDTLALKVLVAEDNVMNQRVAGRLLALLGHQSEMVNNGREALERLFEPSAQFDIVLMDCHMPEMDGYEATRNIRAREKETGGYIPIIGLTAATMKHELDQCFEAGMDDHLTKPVPKDVLQDKLQHFAKMARGRQ